MSKQITVELTKKVTFIIGVVTLAISSTLFTFLYTNAISNIIDFRADIEKFPLYDSMLKPAIGDTVDIYGPAQHTSDTTQGPVAYKNITSNSCCRTFGSAPLVTVPFYVEAAQTKILVELTDLRIDLYDHHLGADLDPQIEFDHEPYTHSINSGGEFLYRGVVKNLNPLTLSPAGVLGSVPRAELFDNYMSKTQDFYLFNGMAAIIGLGFLFAAVYYFYVTTWPQEKFDQWAAKQK